MAMRKTLVFVLMVVALAAPAAAKTYYLDPGRGEEEGSGTEGAPFWSFAKAIEAMGETAESNIVVFVDNTRNTGHRFALDATVTVDVPDKNITFRPWTTASSGEFQVVLDGQGTCGCVMVSTGIVNTVTFRNFTLRNGYDKDGGGGAYRVTLVDCVVADCRTDGNGGGADDCEVLMNCSITGCEAGGNGGGVNNSILKNCLVTGCRASGNGGGACGSSLYNCLVVTNRAPDGFGGGAYHTSLYNCTFDGNAASNGCGFISSTALTNDENAVSVMNTIILDNGKDRWTTNGDRAGDVFRRVFTDGDPRFVDAAHGDYRLLADSPCIDCGYSSVEDLPDVDFAGQPRLRGADVDLGCHEFQRHAAFPPGTLDVSTKAQVVGTVLYAQGPWRLAVDDAARSWLSADVTSGPASNTLHFTFAENTTGADRAAVVSVFTNGSDTAVQRVIVRQVGSAAACAGTRRGVFVGCAKYGPDAKGSPWESETPGADRDAEFYRDLWCGTGDANDPKICKLLLNESATAENVASAVAAVIDALQSEDEFMLSFAGHGVTVLPGWVNGFVLYPNETYLLFADVSNILTRAAAKCAKVICCIDACNAAGVYKFADQLTCDGEIVDRRALPRLTMSAAPSRPEPYRNQSKIAFVVASDYDQNAQGNDRNGEFTAALKEGLVTGAADADGDGVLDLHELYRYAYHTATDNRDAFSADPFAYVQGRCYNQPLLLKTIVGRTAAAKPDVLNPLNPYYVDFVNWLQDGSVTLPENPAWTRDIRSVVTNQANRVPLAGGGTMSLDEAFIAGYAPVRAGVTNEPFRVTIAVTNGTPYLGWSPDRSRDAAPMRTYAISATTSLTNGTNWTTFPADATPEQLQPYRFFKVDVKLRQ